MKVKTSITLSDDLLEIIEEEAKQYRSRSEFIEVVLRNHIQEVLRHHKNQRDAEIINKNEEKLNIEAKDVLDYQINL